MVWVLSVSHTVPIPYPIYRHIGKEDVLDQVSFIVKTKTLINFNNYTPKVIGIHAYFTYLYNTHINTAVKIYFKTADSTGTVSIPTY